MNARTLMVCIGLIVHGFAVAQTSSSPLKPWKFVDAPAPQFAGISVLFKTISFDEATFTTTETMNALPLKELELPVPDGAIFTFQLTPTLTLHPSLAARYPGISAWKGSSSDSPGATVRCEIGTHGFTAWLQIPGKPIVVIQPVPGLKSIYAVFYRTEALNKTEWICHTPSPGKGDNLMPSPSVKGGAAFMRTFRLALACTGEFTQLNGGTVEGALSAMNTLINRINGIYERDLGIHLQLIADNDALIFSNPGSDPYTNSSSHSALTQNQQVCDDIIGADNYDVGHLLTTSNGGLSYLKSVCSSKKAGGVSGNMHSLSDAFIVDYVAHELGHQFGAAHTQNNNCNRNPATAVEPGSGSTIMSYAGVCTPNVQEHSDAYFHAISIAEIRTFIEVNGTCAEPLYIPGELTADAGPDLVLPKGTPFMLHGAAANSSTAAALSYTWEQIDNEVAVMPPLAGSVVGPLFRSWPPSSSPTRSFPELVSLFQGEQTPWEVLPVSVRSMNFRFTARGGNGQIAQDDLVATVSGDAGPFEIIQPQGGELWKSGEIKTILWQVANTDQPPVNCKKVDILLSVDGGLTFAHTIADNTPNDGAFIFVVPALSSADVRIMVRDHSRRFFCITPAPLQIQTPVAQTLSIESVNVSCHDRSDGRLSAHVHGGYGNFSFHWSNGDTASEIKNLPAGTYTVTATNNFVTLTAEATLADAAALEVTVVTLHTTEQHSSVLYGAAGGGTPPYQYHWGNGATSHILYDLPSGNYSLTVTDANGCSQTAVGLVQPLESLMLEYGVASSVTHEWKQVQLSRQYKEMVVVATPILPSGNAASVVTRIRNCEGDHFELRVQVPGSTGVAGPVAVSYMVAEAGTYHWPHNGFRYEAGRFFTQRNSSAQNWRPEQIHYQQTYDKPVVLGQVMSYNDPRWSVFWAAGSDQPHQPPDKYRLAAGKHTGEDPDLFARQGEEIGYIVIESGIFSFGNMQLMAANGPKIIQGIQDNIEGYSYPISGFANLHTAVLSSAGIADEEGAWPVLKGPLNDPAAITCWMMEDQIADAERHHLPEAVAFFAIGEADEHYQDEGEDDPGAEPLTLYPNPAKSRATLRFHQQEMDGPEVLVVDAYGQELYKQPLLPAAPGTREFELPIYLLSPGYYFVLVKDGRHTYRNKLLVHP